MPIVVEDDGRGLGGFDTQTASTLYWKDIPVLLRQPEREEVTENLTFRILSGVMRQNHNLRVLRIHMSSEEDAFFLHTLEVSEEDFQSLKVEQGILVDFAHFPAKIVTLLERCLASQAADMPRFQAVLVVGEGASTFRVVETNDFKQLPHISLAFRPGNDAAVKQFLAFRLGEVKGDCLQLSTELSDTQAARDTARALAADAGAQLAALQEQHARTVMEAAACAKEAAAEAHEERAREKAALREALEREAEAAARRSTEAIDALSRRAEQLEADNRALREAKYALDTQVCELGHKLASAQGSEGVLEQEVASLRAGARVAAQDKATVDVALSETRAKLLAAEEKAATQAEVITQQQARLRDLEGSCRSWEERCDELRAVVGAHEATARDAAAEVLKGNAIIEKLNSDLRLSREKAKRKQAILMRQEEEVAARDASLAASQHELASAQRALDAARAQAAALEAEAGELRAKLDDSRRQLQSNEQMIRWLNQQVTDAQLQGSSVPGSRFQFRPSGAAGALATPATGAASSAAGAAASAAPHTASAALRYSSPAASALGAAGAGALGGKLGHGVAEGRAYSSATITPLPGRGEYSGVGARGGSPAKQPLAVGVGRW